MHSRCTFTLLRLLAIALGAAMSTASASVAGEPIPASPVCEWRGTAPICAGECEPGEITFEKVPDAKYAQHEGFGNPCVGGNKVYCCRLTCPGGRHLEAGTHRERKCIEDVGVPVGTQIITVPRSPLETKRPTGPMEVPSPLEGTKVEKGPVTTSEPAPPTPPTPPPAPTPQPKPVTVLLPVDVYDEPGDNKKKIGVLDKDTQGVFLVEPLRGDNWYNVKGNVPKGIGWVWSGPGYKSLAF